MKKKLLTLMTLLVCAASGVWADTETIFSWSSTSGSATASVTNSYGTITAYSNGEETSTESNVNASQNSFYVLKCNGKNDFSTNHILITLKSGASLKEGDVLTVNGFSNSSDRDSYPKFKFGTSYSVEFSSTAFANMNSSSSNYNSGNLKVAQSVTLGEDAEGVTSFKITRGDQGTSFFVTSVVITRESNKTASDLTVINGKNNIVLGVDGTYTLTKNTDYTTSSTGAITFASSDNDVATVNATTGLITAKALGTATITMSQASDESYLAKNITFTVNVNEVLAKDANFLLPEDVLDFSDADAASAMLNGTWQNYGRPYFGNDGNNNYMTCPITAVFASISVYGSNCRIKSLRSLVNKGSLRVQAA